MQEDANLQHRILGHTSRDYCKSTLREVCLSLHMRATKHVKYVSKVNLLDPISRARHVGLYVSVIYFCVSLYLVLF